MSKPLTKKTESSREGRTNVGLLIATHALASQASGLKVQTIQDFVDESVVSAANKTISDFRAGKSVHIQCDSRNGTKKQ